MTVSTPARPPFPARHAARAGAVAVLAAGLSGLGLTAADAHVRVHPDSTASGSFSALTFRVPNESATAGTVKLSVQLPQDTPFVYVSSKPVDGWTVAATEATLPKPVDLDGTTITKAVRTVTWTAEKGTQIAPGEYQEFSISVGPLPAPGTIVLPAVQTYSDGKVVEWNEPTPADGEEPESPAPELVVTTAEGDEHGGSHGSAPSSAASPAATAAAGAGTSDTTARALGGAGLGVGLVGLVVGLLGLRRRTSVGS